VKELLEFLLKSIVKNEDEIQVEEVDEAGRTILKVKSHPDDIGFIIGKGGRTIRSLKNILKVKAIKEGKMVEIEILEKEKLPEAS